MERMGIGGEINNHNFSSLFFGLCLEGSNPSESDVNIPLLGLQCCRNTWDRDSALHEGYPISRN